jgi:hypothetical protein
MSAFGDLKVSTINGGPTGAKNAIINGNFGINQRGVSGTVTLSAGVYGHDRWKAGASGCTYTFATSNNVTTIDISAGSLVQVIEGINLESGTYTLSWTGTAQGKIGAGSFGNSGITGAAVGGTNLNIEFGTGTVSLVQFELGTVVTPFERRQFGTELQLCMRYYEVFGTGGVGGTRAANTTWTINHKFQVTKRAAPTVTQLAIYTILVPGVLGTSSSSITAQWATVNGTQLNILVAATGSASDGQVVLVTDNDTSGNALAASSEL